MEHIAVIGGGAAGLAAAVTAAERLRAEGAAKRVGVTVYDASDRVGRSILATGNGRCNFSNARLGRMGAQEAGYRNAPFVQAAFDALADRSDRAFALQFGNPVLAFFASHGLAWREEAEGRLYPLANKASVVLDVLRSSAKVAGVEERCGCAIERIRFPRRPGDTFMLRTADERAPVAPQLPQLGHKRGRRRPGGAERCRLADSCGALGGPMGLLDGRIELRNGFAHARSFLVGVPTAHCTPTASRLGTPLLPRTRAADVRARRCARRVCPTVAFPQRPSRAQ